MRRFLPALLALVATTASAGDFVREVRPLLERYCHGCHNDTKAKGGVNLSRFDTEDSLFRDPALWENAVRQIEERAMPPEGGKTPQPTQEERLVLAESLTHLLDNPPPGAVPPDPGRNVVRRLSRAEYNHTIHDLLGVDLRPADDFPADGGGGGGFDNNADTLFVPPILMEKYLAAADAVLAAADPAKAAPIRPVWYATERSVASRNIRRFARRAWRRPVVSGELDRLVAVYERARRGGTAFDPAVLAAYKAVLVSPHFVFRVERDRPGKDPSPIGGHELAVRLGYFLWSSMPDEELAALADSGRLTNAAVLDAQVRRMLSDPKSFRFAEQFVGQWLGTRTLGAVAAPDPSKFPEFTPALQAAMIAEPAVFFAGLVATDGPLLDLLDCDYAWIEAGLARHYGVAGVAGTNFVRVRLPDRHRGGVTGMAAVLTQTSYPRRTSPVLRGKWLLEEVLGTPPPPPPPLVATLPPDDHKQDGLTFRQRLEKHRKDPNCAACHSRLDPLGFALENFDPIGRWRTRIGDEPVDASGQLVGGEAVDGPEALRRALVARRQLFLRHVSGKLLAYALGRGLEYYDMPVVKRIAEETTRDGYRVTTLIRQVVASVPFRMRRGAAHGDEDAGQPPSAPGGG